MLVEDKTSQPKKECMIELKIKKKKKFSLVSSTESIARVIDMISKKNQLQTKIANHRNHNYEVLGGSFRIRSQHSNGIIGELIGHVNFALKINSNDCTFQFRFAWKLFRLHVP